MGRLHRITRITAVLAVGFTGMAILMGLGANLDAQTSTDCVTVGSPCQEAKAYFTLFGTAAIVLTMVAMILAAIHFVTTGAAGVEA